MITQHNLSERLPVARTGDELERLSIALNHMITRLDDAFSNSKRFVTDASHELRTPLTVIQGELENLASDASLPAGGARPRGSTLEEVERLGKIVQKLFALSRLDAGEAQEEWVRLDLAALAGATSDQMLLLAEDKNIKVTRETGVPVFVMGDRARLKQVVVNLLDNAVKYTPPGGSVHLRVYARPGPGHPRDHGHRGWHPCRCAAARLRAVLPRRPRPLVRRGRGGPRPGHRQVDLRRPRRPGRRRERVGSGSRFLVTLPHAAA